MPNGDGFSPRPSLVPGSGPARGARVAVLGQQLTLRGVSRASSAARLRTRFFNDLRLAAGQDTTYSSWARAAEAFSPVAGPLPAQGQHHDDDDDDKDDGPDTDIHGAFLSLGG